MFENLQKLDYAKFVSYDV